MLNNTVLIGKVLKELELIENKDKKKEYILSLGIDSYIRNPNNELEVNQIDVHLSYHLGEASKEYCQEGNIVGIKGMLTSHYENEKLVLTLYGQKLSGIKRVNEKEVSRNINYRER